MKGPADSDKTGEMTISQSNEVECSSVMHNRTRRLGGYQIDVEEIPTLHSFMCSIS